MSSSFNRQLVARIIETCDEANIEIKDISKLLFQDDFVSNLSLLSTNTFDNSTISFEIDRNLNTIIFIESFEDLCDSSSNVVSHFSLKKSFVLKFAIISISLAN